MGYSIKESIYVKSLNIDIVSSLRAWGSITLPPKKDKHCRREPQGEMDFYFYIKGGSSGVKTNCQNSGEISAVTVRTGLRRKKQTEINKNKSFNYKHSNIRSIYSFRKASALISCNIFPRLCCITVPCLETHHRRWYQDQNGLQTPSPRGGWFRPGLIGMQAGVHTTTSPRRISGEACK